MAPRIPYCSFIIAPLVLVAMLLSLESKAQMSSTLYHIKDLPYNNQLNPAFQPTYGSVFLGFGPLGSVSGTVYSNSEVLNIGNLASGDMPSIWKQGAASAESHTFLGAGVDLNIFNLGILAGSWYGTLDAKIKFGIDGGVNNDLMRMVWYGNGASNIIGKPMSMAGTGLLSTTYSEISLGLSKVIKGKVTVGGKIKYLQGTDYMDMGFSTNSHITTAPTSYKITAVMNPTIYSSSVKLKDANLSSIIDDIQDRDIVEQLLRLQSPNRGFAVDLGFSWNVTRRLIVSGSILDLGYIKWQDISTLNSKTKGGEKIVFEGVEINSAASLGNLGLADSISMVVSNSTSFTQRLHSTVYLGANFELAKYLNAGLLLGRQAGVYKNNTLAAVSLNTQNFMVNTSVSLSYLNSQPNVGAGLIIGRRGVQMHIIADNITSLVNTEKTANSLYIRVGGNFLFGRGSKNKKAKPVYQEPELVKKSTDVDASSVDVEVDTTPSPASRQIKKLSPNGQGVTQGAHQTGATSKQEIPATKTLPPIEEGLKKLPSQYMEEDPNNPNGQEAAASL